MIKLRPCPFCNEAPKLQGKQIAHCETCNITLHVQRWNCQLALHSYIRLIEQMREALEIGLDSTRELLHEFGKKYSRTIEKNRRYTERWEAQIKQIEAALEAAERD